MTDERGTSVPRGGGRLRVCGGTQYFPRHVWPQNFAAHSSLTLDRGAMLSWNTAANDPVAWSARCNPDQTRKLANPASRQYCLPKPLHETSSGEHDRSLESITNAFKMHARISFVNTIAERVKVVRQELGWSQVQLAKEVGVSQSSIGNIESGVRQRPRELVSLAKALRVSPEWLETGKGPRTERAALTLVGTKAEPSIRALVEYLAKLAAKQRPTLRKNLGNLLIELVEHPDDTALIEQTIADLERFYGPSIT